MMVKMPTATKTKSKHDTYAPFWAAGMVVFGVAGLSTIWFDLGDFFRSYLLDMTGPAWNYILFRGLFTSQADNLWLRIFTPKVTLTAFLAFCFGVEILQYFHVYDSTFDPWDFLAYVSILVPVFLLDVYLKE